MIKNKSLPFISGKIDFHKYKLDLAYHRE